jgi:glycosyltransferase involved in cell wall biosynthesis
MNTSPVHSLPSRTRASRLFLFANGIYGDHVAGGDVHFLELAKRAHSAGYALHFFGGKALEKRLSQLGIPYDITCTNEHVLDKNCEQSFRGQLVLFFDYFKRLCRSLRQLGRIDSEDFAYAMADGWFDVLPVVLSKSTGKMMILHMEAPTLRQILFRSRPDVDAFRLAALHYWISQQLALRLFRACRHKHVFYVHPDMRARLLKLGFLESEISYVSFGLDAETTDAVPEPGQTYDAVWIGRIHRQKGIKDLLQTLSYLAGEVSGFRALIIGKAGEALGPEIKNLGLSSQVEFSGFVSEEEKVRLLKASRVFLMPSRHEGSPRTVGEALLCDLPVVAYDLQTYRPIFGELVRYVPCFDLDKFKAEAKEQILKMRAGENYLARMNLGQFRKENSWATVSEVFCRALAELQRVRTSSSKAF